MPRLRHRATTRASRLESKFALYWRGLGGPELQREFVFHPERKWRADFAHVGSRTLIEIEGGIFLAGGGRHNRTLMAMLKAQVNAPVIAAEDAGWDGDALEAEGFAYLAVRAKKGLPLSLPTTTGVKEPMSGGKYWKA